MALPPGPPDLAAVDQGRLPRGSSVSLRWIRISGNDSPGFAPAVHPGKDARQRAQLGPWHRNTSRHWQNRISANNFYGATTQFRHEYARLAAYRKEENSSPAPTNSHLVLLIAQNIARPPQALLGHPGLPGRSAELLSETHHSRSALEYGDTAMSASARVTECLNEDRG